MDISQLEDATGSYALEDDGVGEIEFDAPEEPEAPVSNLAPESSLELEEPEMEEELEDDEASNSKTMAFLASQLPFLYKIISKLNKKSAGGAIKKQEPKGSQAKELPKNIRDPKNEINEEENKSKFELFLEKNAPSLASLAVKLRPKKDIEDLSEEEDEEGEKPKRKLKVIHLVIIGALGFILLWEDEPEPQQPALKPRPKRVVKKEQPAVQKPAVPNEKEPTTAQEPVDEATEALSEAKVAVEDNVLSDENLEDAPEEVLAEVEAIKDKEFEPARPAPVDDPEPDTASGQEGAQAGEQGNIGEDLDELFADDPMSKGLKEAARSATPPEPEEDPVVEAPPRSELDVSPEPEPSGRLDLEDAVIDEVVQTGGGDEITEAILKELESTAKERRDKALGEQKVGPAQAPSYLESGPGLVYNCSGRHWACVARPSFEQCGKNFAWNAQEGSAIECYPSELYENEMDCASMQQYKIDMAVETKFCR